MSSRLKQPDTPADEELRTCVNARPPRSFVMTAGAGSGKTTSLAKALDGIINAHGRQLQVRRQRIACITYTEIAAAEIWEDVGNSPVVHVSTIHSFLWMIIRPFQRDIKAWVARRIQERIDELKEKASGFGPRVQQRTREKNAADVDRYTAERARIADVPLFTYGTGNNYSKGILGHDDIIRMVPQLLAEKPLLRRILAQQFPIVFVDESQDTMPDVVNALTEVQRSMGDAFCLGFFGDPMQKIYTTGIGQVDPGAGWADIKKSENFRCPTNVLAVANKIRRDDDGLEQTGGRKLAVDGQLQDVRGTARLFILPADDHREQNLQLVRKWIAAANNDSAWLSSAPRDVKVLVIVHRMAAARLGFAQLYSALNDKAPSAFKDGFADASAWPLRPFWTLAIPLADAMQNGRAFDAMSLVRQLSPRLAKEAIARGHIAAVLAELHAASKELAALMASGSGVTVRDVLNHMRGHDLIALDPRIIAYLDMRPVEAGSEDADEDEVAAEVNAMDAFLQCPADEMWGYAKYVNTQSPFSTQQGVKGAEFERVLVVLDDEEGRHVQFSYEKYFGIKALSENDRKNIAEGNDSVISRTRRLFYVCCTRALSDLAVVLFTTDPTSAVQAALSKGWFDRNEVRTLADLLVDSVLPA
ncbi:UvrD-helicase domain-containing protein [Methylocystis sp.]|uniref:UvrD-helicase domain-containing protein n=1 Tax=Methylocystis sp. TaxID=1911079 RepID=UPI0025EE08CB|nr:UvrD-helicase domain-containing protein [Methylocystis sp.]